MKSALRLVVSLAAVLTAGVSLVEAQSRRPERPYRGLFASGVGDLQQSLILNVSLGGGYDDNLFAQERTTNEPPTGKGGSFGSISSGLSYSFSTSRVSVGASLGTNTRYSAGARDNFYTGYSGGVGLSAGLWRGSRLSTSASVGYQPYFTFNLLPSPPVETIGEATLITPEYAAVARDYLQYGVTASLSQQVSRRGSFAVSAGQQNSEFSGDNASFSSRNVSAGYSHTIARGLSLTAGYGYREGRARGVAGTQSVHSLNAGVAYNRALSFSRRTSLAFSTGSSAFSDGSRTAYFLTGNVQLLHEIGRTWRATAGYSRGLQFIDALGEAYISDSASFTLNGLINRRLEFHSDLSLALAQPGISSSDGGIDNYRATAGIGYALNRFMSLGVDYSYYHYQFGAQAELRDGFSREVDRQSIRANLSFWAPLLQRARRPNAAR